MALKMPYGHSVLQTLSTILYCKTEYTPVMQLTQLQKALLELKQGIRCPIFMVKLGTSNIILAWNMADGQAE